MTPNETQNFPEWTPEQLNEMLTGVQNNTAPALKIGEQSFEFKPENATAIQGVLEAQRQAEEARYNELKAQIETIKQTRPEVQVPGTPSPVPIPAITPKATPKPEDLNAEQLLMKQLLRKEIGELLGVEDPKAAFQQVAQGTALSIAAAQKLYEQQQAATAEFNKQLAQQARAQAAWAFASSTPGFESTVENVKALDALLDEHKLPPSKQNYEFAYWKAQQVGKIKPRGQNFANNQSQSRVPNLPAIGGVGAATSGPDAALLARLNDPNITSDQLAQFMQRAGIPMDF